MRLDNNTIKNAILTSIRNSQELIDEAEILFTNQKYARAYLLSHISIEETSKCSMLLKIIAFNIWNSEINIKNVKKRFSNHKDKIKNFILFSKIFGIQNIDLNNLKKIIDDCNDFKNNSLYVSWSNENVFALPSDMYTKDRVEEILKLALEYCKIFTSISINLIEKENEIYDVLKKIKSLEFTSEIIQIEKNSLQNTKAI